jgi:alpha-tubulin suppressor-like RCC1 family protein
LHSCAIEVGGAVQCWGGNADGELGSGQYKSGAAPQSVKGLSGPAKSISAGLTHTCAVMAAGGDLYCWGTNRYGELGGGTLGMPSHSAVHVSLPRPTLEVSCGAGYTCAVGDDGSVRCWGQNADSELGYPQTSSLMSPVPVLVDGVKTVTTNLPGHRLAAGTSHTCVLGADSNTHCWGSNGSGELGDGTRNSPEPATKLVPALSLIGVTAGEESSAGVDNNGAIWIWGSRSPSFSVPSLVSPALLPGDIVASSVEMRWSHACAVSNSGAVWCWGQNASGQLGNGTRTASLTPVRVSGF